VHFFTAKCVSIDKTVQKKKLRNSNDKFNRRCRRIRASVKENASYIFQSCSCFYCASLTTPGFSAKEGVQSDSFLACRVYVRESAYFQRFVHISYSCKLALPPILRLLIFLAGENLKLSRCLRDLSRSQIITLFV